jgi:uncharacterized protein YkwD
MTTPPTRSTAPRRLIALTALLALLVTAPSPVAASLADRRELLAATNADRIDRGLPRLRLNTRLSKLAQRHSRQMARADRLFHTSDPDRYYLRGLRWWAWGENVGYVSGSARDLQRLFMRSRPHRDNILTRRFDRVAIGAIRRDGVLWATVFFYDG